MNDDQKMGKASRRSLDPPEDKNMIKCLNCETEIEYDEGCVSLCPDCFDILEPTFLEWVENDYEGAMKQIVQRKLMSAKITIDGKIVKPVITSIVDGEFCADILTK